MKAESTSPEFCEELVALLPAVGARKEIEVSALAPKWVRYP